ncbi:hypothetical protein HK102_013657, partial [Quaeritorhiza haematococci]
MVSASLTLRGLGVWYIALLILSTLAYMQTMCIAQAVGANENTPAVHSAETGTESPATPMPAPGLFVAPPPQGMMRTPFPRTPATIGMQPGMPGTNQYPDCYYYYAGPAQYCYYNIWGPNYYCY